MIYKAKLNSYKVNQTGHPIPPIPTLKRLTPENHKFKARLATEQDPLCSLHKRTFMFTVLTLKKKSVYTSVIKSQNRITVPKSLSAFKASLSEGEHTPLSANGKGNI